MNKLPYADTMNYWKSSNSSPDTWLDKAEKMIEKQGGAVSIRGVGKEGGNMAYFMEFEFPPEKFRLVWPVLPVKKDDQVLAAKRQAATMMFHDIKARALRFKLFGARTAYFEFLLLPDGRTAGQVSGAELGEFTPKALLSQWIDK